MIVNLQVLRGLAAMMVVVFHLTDSPGRLGAGANLPGFGVGEAGVDIFFVLSGFIIWMTTVNGPAAPLDFMRRRIVRVVPLYWLLTLLLANAILVAPQFFNTSRLDFWHLLASLAFVPYPHPVLDVPNPLLFVGWTLNMEMMFYALFAPLLLLAPERRAVAAVGLFGAIALFGMAARPEGALGFWTEAIILDFAYGIVIGALVSRGTKVALLPALAMVATGLLLLPILDDTGPRFLVAGLPAALLVAGAIFAEQHGAALRNRIARLLGDASYSIYLTHVLAIPVAQIGWVMLGLPVAGLWGWAFVIAAGAGCAVAGILCYLMVERPLLALMRPPRPMPAQVA